MKNTHKTPSLAALFVVGIFTVSNSYAQNPPRPNSFIIHSVQAGSTMQISNLRVVDLDSGAVVYTNGFANASDATNGLNLFYWPQGGSDSTNYVIDGPMTTVVNGTLQLETTGFNQNGSGGYESHTEAEYAGRLPKDFLVDFYSTRMQWAGWSGFDVFYRAPSDAFVTYGVGGPFSTNRIPPFRLDCLELSGSGNWFNTYGLNTNYIYNSGGWAIPFSAPSGDPTQKHRYGIALSNSVASFYLDGVLLNSTNISNWISTVQIGLIKAVKPSFSGLSVGTNYQLQVSSNLNTWTNQGAVFTATNASMVYPQYWDVANWNQLFFRLEQQ